MELRRLAKCPTCGAECKLEKRGTLLFVCGAILTLEGTLKGTFSGSARCRIRAKKKKKILLEDVRDRVYQNSQRVSSQYFTWLPPESSMNDDTR
jgi:hypothetical protein